MLRAPEDEHDASNTSCSSAETRNVTTRDLRFKTTAALQFPQLFKFYKDPHALLAVIP